jgi:hypothetical protein
MKLQDSIQTEDQNNRTMATITANMTDKQPHNNTGVLVYTGSHEYMIQQFHIKNHEKWVCFVMVINIFSGTLFSLPSRRNEFA